MARLRPIAICFVALAILIGFPGSTLSASAPGGLFEAPSRVETLSISVGDRPLNATPRHRVYDPRAGWTIDRGAVVERLIPRTVGVEQMWTFAERPAGEGALVVRVAAPGAVYVGADGHGLTFRNVRTGALWTYGHGTWIDADGRRTAVPARWVGGTIELRVPAAVVNTSMYPAVLDPVIGADVDVPNLSSVDQINPEVAFGYGVYLAVWENYVFGTNVDLYGARFDADGALLDTGGLGIYVDNPDVFPHTIQTSPSVAYGPGVFLVAWGDDRNGRSDIYAKRVWPNGTIHDGDGILLASLPLAWEQKPSVAYHAAQDRFLVVYELYTESGTSQTYIRARAVNRDGIAQGEFAISEDVRIQQSPDIVCRGEDCLVVYEHYNPAGQYDIVGKLIAADGSIGQPINIAVNVYDEMRNPAVSADDDGYLVVWQRQLRSTGVYEIRGTRVLPDGSVETEYPGTLIAAEHDESFTPETTFDGHNHFVVWIDGRGQFPNVIGTFVSPSGTVLEPDGFVVSSNKIHSTPYIASDAVGGALVSSRYKHQEDDYNATTRLVRWNFTEFNGERTVDGDIELAWTVNPDIDAPVGVNLYRSISFEEGYDKVNANVLPVSGSYLDTDVPEGVTAYYWAELQYDPEPETWFDTGPGFTDRQVVSIAARDDGSLYIGTYSPGDVYRSLDDGVTWSKPHTSGLGGLGRVSAFVFGSDGNVYTATDGSVARVYRLDENQSTWVSLGDVGSETGVRSLIEALDGTLWAGAIPGGKVFRYIQGMLAFAGVSGNGASGIPDIFQTANSSLLAGTQPGTEDVRDGLVDEWGLGRGRRPDRRHGHRQCVSDVCGDDPRRRE